MLEHAQEGGSMIFWWIEKKNGQLAELNRELRTNFGFHGPMVKIVESGCPQLRRIKKEAQAICRPGERPVKVKVEKVGE